MNNNIGALPNDGRKTNYRWKVLSILWILYLVNFCDRIAVQTFLPLIRVDLELTHAEVGFAASVFFFAYSLAQLSAGFFADKFGAKKVMMASIVFFTAVTFVTGLVRNYVQFLICRFGLAIGEGHHFVPSNRSIAEWFPQAEKGRASAIFSTTYALAPGIIPPIAALLATWVGGWRPVFFLLAIPGVICVVLLAIYFSNSPSQMVAKGRVNKAEEEHIRAGIVTTGNDVPIGKAIKTLVRDKSFVFYCLCSFFGTGTFWGATIWISSFCMEHHGFSMKAMGFFAAMPFIIGCVVAIFSGVLIDKLFKGNTKVVLIFAYLFGAVAFYVLGQVAVGDIGMLIFFLLAIGAGLAIERAAIYAYPLLRYPKEIMGSAFGIANFVGQMGGFVIPLICSFTIYKLDDGSFNYEYVWLTLAIAYILGAIFIAFSSVKVFDQDILAAQN